MGSFYCTCLDGYNTTNPKLPPGVSNPCTGICRDENVSIMYLIFDSSSPPTSPPQILMSVLKISVVKMETVPIRLEITAVTATKATIMHQTWFLFAKVCIL